MDQTINNIQTLMIQLPSKGPIFEHSECCYVGDQIFNTRAVGVTWGGLNYNSLTNKEHLNHSDNVPQPDEIVLTSPGP